MVLELTERVPPIEKRNDSQGSTNVPTFSDLIGAQIFGPLQGKIQLRYMRYGGDEAVSVAYHAYPRSTGLTRGF